MSKKRKHLALPSLRPKVGKCPYCEIEMPHGDIFNHIKARHRHLLFKHVRKQENGIKFTPAPDDVGIDKPRKGNPYVQGGLPGQGKKS